MSNKNEKNSISRVLPIIAITMTVIQGEIFNKYVIKIENDNRIIPLKSVITEVIIGL
tara:strand:- start:10 stop:180 length:171 start_codon:yes stop_codon:yes gene_type:complete